MPEGYLLPKLSDTSYKDIIDRAVSVLKDHAIVFAIKNFPRSELSAVSFRDVTLPPMPKEKAIGALIYIFKDDIKSILGKATGQ